MQPLFKYNGFISGQCYQMKYNPKNRDILEFYDRAPLFIFVSYLPQLKLMQGLNLHFLTPAQRKIIVKFLSRNSGSLNNKTPLTFDWWSVVRKMIPAAILSWRRYLPNRMKSVEHIPFKNWDEDVIKSQTAKLVGLGPEELQQIMAYRINRYAGRPQTYRNKVKAKDRRKG